MNLEGPSTVREILDTISTEYDEILHHENPEVQ